MLPEHHAATRRALWIGLIGWFLGGAAVASTMLFTWPFPVELQLALLFVAFAILTLLKVGYGQPIRPLAFLFGSLVPYAIAKLWLASL